MAGIALRVVVVAAVVSKFGYSVRAGTRHSYVSVERSNSMRSVLFEQHFKVGEMNASRHFFVVVVVAVVGMYSYNLYICLFLRSRAHGFTITKSIFLIHIIIWPI